jgi:capsular polysaccharide biosynthesis protein
MTLKRYLEIIIKNVWIIIIVVLVALGATYFFTTRLPDKYTGSLTIYTYIQPDSNSHQDYYQYDGYYLYESSSLFTDSVVGWFNDPSNVSLIYDNANQQLPHTNIKNYQKLIQAKKNEQSSVQILVSSDSENYVRSVLESSREFTLNKIDSMQKKGLSKNIYLDTSDPFIITEKPSLTINMVVALIISIALGLSIVYFTEYMKVKDN